MRPAEPPVTVQPPSAARVPGAGSRRGAALPPGAGSRCRRAVARAAGLAHGGSRHAARRLDRDRARARARRRARWRRDRRAPRAARKLQRARAARCADGQPCRRRRPACARPAIDCSRRRARRSRDLGIAAASGRGAADVPAALPPQDDTLESFATICTLQACGPSSPSCGVKRTSVPTARRSKRPCSTLLRWN